MKKILKPKKFKRRLLLPILLIIFSGIGFFIFQQFSSALDNCGQLDGTEICIQSVSPKSGPLTGGDTLTINGKNFPYAPTSSYSTNGLAVFFDGINNTGEGDIHHSDDTRTWRSLDPNHSFTTLRKSNLTTQGFFGDGQNCSGAEWKNNGYKGEATCFFAARAGEDDQVGTLNETNGLTRIMPNIPVGNENSTVEVVYDSQYMDNPAEFGGTNSGISLYGFGLNTGTSKVNNLWFWINGCGTQTAFQPNCFRNWWMSNDIDPLINNKNPQNLVRNLAITYNNSLPNLNRRFWYNGEIDDLDPPEGSTSRIPNSVIKYTGSNCPEPKGNSCRDNNKKDTNPNGYFFINAMVAGANANPTAIGRKVVILAVRVYNRTLSNSEIEEHYKLDEIRFLDPPQINIGSNKCNQVIVVSTTQLRCTVPPNDIPGAKDVTFSYKSNSGVSVNLKIPMVYQYLQNLEGDPQITSVKPNILPKYEDTTISITGNKFGVSGNVTSVTIQGKSCSPIEDQTDSSLKCHYGGLLPNENGGFKDVIIYLKDSPTQQIVGFSSFYALEISKNPVKYTISPTPNGYEFQNVSIENDYIGNIDVIIKVPAGISNIATTLTDEWKIDHSDGIWTFSTKKNLDEDVVSENDIVNLLKDIKLVGQANGNVSVSLINHSW